MLMFLHSCKESNKKENIEPQIEPITEKSWIKSTKKFEISVEGYKVIFYK